MTRKKVYVNPVEAIDDKLQKVELTEPVEPTKFDRHMRKARRDDIRSRRRVFIQQIEADEQRDSRRQDITPAVY